jgi:hypothetical protein
MNNTKIYPPWTADECVALNRWQFSGTVHPFTHCAPGVFSAPRIDSSNEGAAPLPIGPRGYLGHARLVATPEGWVCPMEMCGGEQDWAWDFMLRVEDFEAGLPEWWGK